MSADGFGILSLGCYLPVGRLPGEVPASANAWFAPSLRAKPGRSRSFCSWDEDALTMAVEAGRNCLADGQKDTVAALTLASTSLPFADRSNAGVVREALDLPADIHISDTGGSVRAGSMALKAALEGGVQQLVLAADCVDAKPASAQELNHGHGAAGILVGEGAIVARLLSSVSLHQDFVDHYRAAGERFEYALEPRWVRDAGYRDQVAATVDEALESAAIAADRVTALAIAAPGGLAPAVRKHLGKVSALPTGDSKLEAGVGFCGTADALLKLAEALESANAGDIVLLLALGQGIDVLVLEVVRPPETQSLARAIAAGVREDNYSRYLALRGLLPLETGIRAERDNRTALSAFWRKHEAITAFKGGKCSRCGTLQFPPTRLCVNCGAEGTQEPVRLADMTGRVRSFTEDWLAYTPKPPLVFGNVGFEDGANVMMEFTDVEPGQLEVGAPVDMRFRIKDLDERRAFRRYFWKPAPLREAGDA